MAIQVRYPKFDFSDFKFHWSHNLAYSMDRNATGMIPSPVEPWLIKLLNEAMPLLPPGYDWLKEETQAFIAQESQHFRQHRTFNRIVAESGFPYLAELEKRLASELDEFNRTRSLKWRLAYADGFETLGAVSGLLWFEKSDEMIGGLDNCAIRMWKWHMAEEFEHREICFQFFKAIYGRGPIRRVTNGYFFRLYGLAVAIRHLRGIAAEAVAYMRGICMARMTEAEKRQLEQDTRAFNRFQLRTFLGPLLMNLLPWYDPARKREPRGLFDYLRKFEKNGEWSATASAGPA